MPTPKNIVIIGAGAAGASTAARLRRLDEFANILLLDKSPDVSVASCGMPYYIGGEITDRARMAIYTPASLGELLNVSVLAETEVLAIDRTNKTVKTRNTRDHTSADYPYDTLVIATGAAPVRPDLPGVNDTRIRVLRSLADMDGIHQAATKAERVVIVGAGFIGLELAEQLHHDNRLVTVVEMAAQVLPPLDSDMAAPVRAALEAAGVTVHLEDMVTEFSSGGESLIVKLRSGRELPTDLVILAAGVRPDTSLAAAAGLETSKRGHIIVNEFLQTSDSAIYAAGDAVELFDRQSGARNALPMGGPANRQGRIIADAIAAPATGRPYRGNLGTAIARVFGVVAATTGQAEKTLKANGTTYQRTLVSDFHHASYYPGASLLTLKVLWSPESGMILGAQAVGAEGVDKRIDVFATAIAAGMTIDDLVDLELCYAPPFGSARDVVNTAGFAASNSRLNLVTIVDTLPAGSTVIDVRPTAMANQSPIPGAI